MKFKYAFRGISSKFIYSFLIIAQLVFGFYAVYENINLYKTMHLESNKVEKFFKGKKVYSLEAQDVVNNSKYFADIINALDKIENTHKYTFMRNINVAVYNPIFNNYKQFEQYDYKWSVNGKIYFLAKNITIDRTYLKTYPLKIDKGRIFNNNEFKFIGKNNAIVPVVVGSNYGKYYKVGDEILIQWRKIHYRGKIIGILKNNEYNPGDVRDQDNKYINLNDYIISTDSIFESKYDLCTFSLLNGSYILFDDSENTSAINKKLKNITKTFNYIPGVKDVGIRDLSSYISQNTDLIKEQLQIVSLTAISIIIFVCITYAISLLDSIERRKKEYAIHIMSGGRLCDIAGIVYTQIFIIFSISYIITASILYYKYGKLININNLLILLLVMIIVSGISALIPVIRIFKLNVSNLVKGDE
ncbi:ABC transporter permease [Clostridium tyrobutyricum]|uniref:ABC transporter permease n=1 Tax=Clostridium tyrobutyricum TaxID=1519 RepID=UPI001C390E5F|nr:ABC transporter permease [Clostridium tyrobutyricum]MBV4431468.1 ABC transporter permease [Clostridium tyrobutyricum]